MADDLFEQTVKATSSRHQKNATRTKKKTCYMNRTLLIYARAHTHTAHRTHLHDKLKRIYGKLRTLFRPCDKTYAGIVALAVCCCALRHEKRWYAREWNPIQLLKIDHIWFRWRKENSIFGRVRICEKFIFGQKQAKRTRTYRCLDTSDENN